MDKDHLDSFKKSTLWEKEFKNVEDTMDRGVLNDNNIPDFAKSMQLIVRIGDIIKSLGEKHLAKYDLSIAQKGVLVALYFSKNEYLTQIQLSKFVYTSKSNISSLLDRMEKKGFIKREENLENKREKKVIITNDGRAIFEKFLKDSEKLPIDQIISKEEAIFLNNILLKIRNKYKKILEK